MTTDLQKTHSEYCIALRSSCVTRQDTCNVLRALRSSCVTRQDTCNVLRALRSSMCYVPPDCPPGGGSLSLPVSSGACFPGRVSAPVAVLVVRLARRYVSFPRVLPSPGRRSGFPLM